MRRPLAKKALSRFTSCFVKEQIELACGGVGIHLVIPSLLFARAKPLDDAPVFFRGQTVDSGLNLLNSAHARSLSPLAGGRTNVRRRSGDLPYQEAEWGGCRMTPYG